MSEIYGVVYRVTCLVNGKLYHGQTVNPRERWPHHFRADSNCHALRNAIKKYGREKFTFEVIAQASTKEELDTIEKHWVATSMSPVGYNIKEGGANGRPSEETKRKLSVIHKDIQNRPEVRARNSAGVKRAMAQPEVKERHRASLKERYNQPGERLRQGQRMKEVHARPGEKEKRSKALKASWDAYTPDEREQRIEQIRQGYTPDVRARIGAAAQENMARPEVKEKMRQRVRASFTPERRESMSMLMKSLHAMPGDKEKRGAAISRAHNTPEGKAKLARRRRRGESIDAWQERIAGKSEETA